VQLYAFGLFAILITIFGCYPITADSLHILVLFQHKPDLLELRFTLMKFGYHLRF